MMVNHRIRSFPVVDDGKLVGMISRGDVMRALKQATYDGK
jgi:CBS domain-containing protein